MTQTIIYARLRDDVGLRRVLHWYADVISDDGSEHISGTLTEVLDKLRTRETNK